MENLSNNSKRSNSHSPLGLWLFVFCMLPYMAIAQAGFNKLYTNDATASLFVGIAAHGSNGAFLCSTVCVDSVSGNQGLRISRYNKDGEVQASNFFFPSPHPALYLYPDNKGIVKVHDNLYAMVGKVLASGAQYSYILTSDSNGVVLNFKDIMVPVALGVDTFTNTSALGYDSNGHLIVAGHFTSSIKSGDTSRCVLYKLDTALNIIWHKAYNPSGIFRSAGIFSLMVDASGYTICGGAENQGMVYDTNYRNQSIMIKTDTAGNQQWYYASPKAVLTQVQGDICEALRTKDGGYLYSTSAMAYNAAIPTAAIDLQSKRVLIKLDAARNKLWQTAIDDYYSRFSGLSYIKIIELADSSFKVVTHVTVDSFGKNFKYGRYMQLHYSKDGNLIYRRILRAPKDASDTSSESAGGMYDMIATAEKGFVMCGVYYNRTIGASLPSQRGWIMKVDSNGCIGPSDPQCDPLSIPKLPQIAKVGFSVYPNPSTGLFVIKSLDPSFVGMTSVVKVYDLLGRAVHQQKLSFSNKEAVLKLHLPSAKYILELSNEDGTLQRERVVIK